MSAEGRGGEGARGRAFREEGGSRCRGEAGGMPVGKWGERGRLPSHLQATLSSPRNHSIAPIAHASISSPLTPSHPT